MLIKKSQLLQVGDKKMTWFLLCWVYVWITPSQWSQIFNEVAFEFLHLISWFGYDEVWMLNIFLIFFFNCSKLKKITLIGQRFFCSIRNLFSSVEKNMKKIKTNIQHQNFVIIKSSDKMPGTLIICICILWFYYI